MKEKYTAPEIKAEILTKTDVLCDSKQYNISGKFDDLFDKLNFEDLI